MKYIFLFSVLGLSSCSLPPINFYHVSTGYFLTDETAEPILDRRIELFVTDPTAVETEKEKTDGK